MCHLLLLLPIFALPVFGIFPFPAALSSYLAVLGVSLFLYFKVMQAMSMAPRLGREAMLGKIVTVIRDIAPEGKIAYDAEIWSASSEGRSFSAGDKVRIEGFWHLELLVREIPVDGGRVAPGT